MYIYETAKESAPTDMQESEFNPEKKLNWATKLMVPVAAALTIFGCLAVTANSNTNNGGVQSAASAAAQVVSGVGASNPTSNSKLAANLAPKFSTGEQEGDD